MQNTRAPAYLDGTEERGESIRALDKGLLDSKKHRYQRNRSMGERERGSGPAKSTTTNAAPFARDGAYPKHPFAKASQKKSVASARATTAAASTPGTGHNGANAPPVVHTIAPGIKTIDDDFLKSLRDTGKLNWKKAPKAIKTRYYGMYAVLFSIPLIAVSSYEMYRRLEGKSTKKVQQGEILEDKTIRKFDEAEKWQVEKNSIMYKIFGRDYFLDGFTSKTMRRPSEKGSSESDKEN